MSRVVYWSTKKKLLLIIKVSIGLQKGLEWIGWVSYQFRYQISLACFKARYPKLELKDDPFTDYPED